MQRQADNEQPVAETTLAEGILIGEAGVGGQCSWVNVYGGSECGVEGDEGDDREGALAEGGMMREFE